MEMIEEQTLLTERKCTFVAYSINCNIWLLVKKYIFDKKF